MEHPIRRTRLLCATAAAVGSLLLLAATAPAQERMTANTLKLAPGQSSPPATIADMAWLAGHWKGDGLGGRSEETWSPPEGGVMLGTYRHLKDDKKDGSVREADFHYTRVAK